MWWQCGKMMSAESGKGLRGSEAHRMRKWGVPAGRKAYTGCGRVACEVAKINVYNGVCIVEQEGAITVLV